MSAPDAAPSPPDAAGIDASVPNTQPDAAPPPFAGDLVGHYLVDPLNPGGNAAGTGADGACTICPERVDDTERGQAFKFTRVETIEIKHDDRFAAEQGFTVALWLRPSAYDVYMTPIGKAVGPRRKNSWKLNNLAEGLEFETALDDVSDYMRSQGNPLPLDTWSHVTMVWDRQTKYLYVNGTLLISRQADISFDTGSILIGADLDVGQPDYPYEGLMSDVRIYDRPLTESEIAERAGSPAQ